MEDMNGNQFERLQTLVGAPGTSGFEENHQTHWREMVEPVADRVVEDEYGNVVAILNPDAETGVAFASHADQIGLIVRRIDDDGFLHPAAVGRVDPTTLPGRRVRIHTDSETITGVIGQQAIHLREEQSASPETVGSCRIDIGATADDDVPDSLRIGDPITFDIELERVRSDRIVAPALDNRAGSWVVAETFRRVAERDIDRTIVGISTVGEEIGHLGAEILGRPGPSDGERLSLSALVSRLYAIDVTFATDHPLAPTDTGSDIELGGGPVVTRGGINDRNAVEAALDSGTEVLDSQPQLEAIGGMPGTDTEAFVRATGGLPGCYIGIPCRYMHTPGEMVDTTDLVQTCELLEGVARHGA
jgi:endoglucanase